VLELKSEIISPLKLN